MRLSKGDTLFVIILLLILFLASGYLYLDFTGLGNEGQTRVVGVLKIKQNIAQRKYTKQVVWEGLENDVPVYNLDTIRTGDDSQATLVLNDKTEIDIDSNTMIVLNIKENQTGIDFRGGNIQVKGSKNDGDINIVSGDKIISLNDGKGDVSLEGDDPEQLSMKVNSGEVDVESDGKKTQVKENEQASLSGAQIDVAKVPFVLQTPGQNSKYFIDQDRVNLPFEFQANVSGPYRIELSKSRSFRRVIESRTVSSDSSTSLSLAKGKYYWRVVPARGELSVDVIPHAFELIAREPATLTLPLNGEVFTHTGEQPYVNFGWKGTSLASSYIVEVATDSSFSNIIKTLDGTTTFVATRIPDGKYFWRVRTRSFVEQAATTSSVRSFEVTRKANPDPPRPVRPANGSDLARALIESEGVTFNWLTDGNASGSTLQIFTNPSFAGNAVVVKNVGSNFTTVSEDLKPGTYYWRVQTRDRSGSESPFSTTYSFQVKENLVLGTNSPRDGESIPITIARDAGVGFSWDNPKPGSRFRLVLSNRKEMTGPLESKTIDNNHSSIQLKKPGTYYWQAHLLDDNGSISYSSGIHGFDVVQSLRRPIPIFPGEGVRVDMTSQDSLPFRWEAGDETDGYVFKLYSLVGGRANKVLERRVSGTSIVVRDLSILDVGPFLWSIQGLQEIDGKKVDSPESRVNFRITLGESEAPEVLTPEIQYIEKKDENQEE